MSLRSQDISPAWIYQTSDNKKLLVLSVGKDQYVTYIEHDGARISSLSQQRLSLSRFAAVCVEKVQALTRPEMQSIEMISV